MASTTLGRLTQVWQGTYAGGTAYVVDDVVEYNGGTYICTAATTGNLPTDTSYWDNMATASGLSSIGSLAAGDVVYYNGSAWTRLGIGSAGQALKVNSGATALEYGSVGKLINVGWYADRTRRNHGASDNVTKWSNINFYNKQRADTTLFINGEIQGKQNQGNDKSVPVITFTDASSNQWRTTASYRGGGNHAASLRPYGFHFCIGPATNSQHRITGSATYAASGQITWTGQDTSNSGSSSAAHTTTNPDSNDDSRLYNQNDTRGQHTKAIIFEVLL